VAGLFFGQDTGKIEKLSEDFIDVAATGVIAFDQLLKFFQVIGPRAVQPHHAFQLRAHRRL
jgi:hypothetical protein